MAADPLAIRAYYAGMSPNFAAKITLSQLIINMYAALSSPIAVPNFAACEIEIFANTSNTHAVLVGDENISTTNYAYALVAGASRRYGPGRMSAVPLQDIFVMSDDGSTNVKLGIEAIPT